MFQYCYLPFFQILFFLLYELIAVPFCFRGLKTFIILRKEYFSIFFFSIFCLVLAVWENLPLTLSQISLIEVTRISCQCMHAPLRLRPSRIIYGLPRYRLTLVLFLTPKRLNSFSLLSYLFYKKFKILMLTYIIHQKEIQLICINSSSSAHFRDWNQMMMVTFMKCWHFRLRR